MTARAASATREARKCSEPGCLDARDGATAAASCDDEGRGEEAMRDETRAVRYEHQLSDPCKSV